ncbi:MAG: hypothetical protein HXL36_04785 [Prevotellaceae bacterium]|nr:hypothetical protein [Prevotellaceae bacterium]
MYTACKQHTLRAFTHCSTAVSSTVGDRHTHCLTAVNSAADGRRTMNLKPYCENKYVIALQPYSCKAIIVMVL